jgi:hypothetical protein
VTGAVFPGVSDEDGSTAAGDGYIQTSSECLRTEYGVPVSAMARVRRGREGRGCRTLSLDVGSVYFGCIFWVYIFGMYGVRSIEYRAQYGVTMVVNVRV